MTVAKGMVYSFNAENRLVEAAPQNPQQGSIKSTYIYDYMGRRARKTLYTYSSGAWQKQKNVSFIYDGWNMVKESEKTSDSSPEVPVYYVWGLDLSQSMQGAGGVGGLIASVKSGNEYLYSCDANGNVGQMVKSTDGSIAARYEYDPFGKTIFAEGPMAGENSYRFSTKYQDAETGFYYYGYRYYDVEMGRWINRDPIGEMGGMNLNAITGNGAINGFDSNGRYWYDMHYLGAYLTLRATGRFSASEAWKRAYYSSIPDSQSDYDAMNISFFGRFFTEGAAREYQRILHSLNGLSENEIKEFRECLRCLFKTLDGEEGEIFKGILLHALGDTYGHLELKPIYKKDSQWPYQTDPKILREYSLHPDQRPGQIIGYEDCYEGYGAYVSFIGHGLNGTIPDQVSARPELAKEYLRDVYDLNGGASVDREENLSKIFKTIDLIAKDKIDNDGSYDRFQELYNNVINDNYFSVSATVIIPDSIS